MRHTLDTTLVVTASMMSTLQSLSFTLPSISSYVQQVHTLGACTPHDVALICRRAYMVARYSSPCHAVLLAITSQCNSQ